MILLRKIAKNSLIIAFILLWFTLLQPVSQSISEDESFSIVLDSLTEHSPIIIDSNADFSSLGFPGNGSSINPYIIENLSIVSLSETGSAIQIGSTHSYFIIRNCVLSAEYLGIFIQDTVIPGTAQIINNTITSISNDGGGICCSGNTTIENNTISGFMQGIHLNYASYSTIKGNNILQSYYQGINIRYSSFTEITQNTIKNSNQHGLAIVGTSSSHNIIHHNTFINNSNELTYRIDGERTGDIASQGYDEGQSNIWYEEENKHGNWWDDYDGEEEYKIDGPADAKDEYPLKLGETKRTSFFLYVTIITVVGLVWLIKIKIKTPE